MKLKTFVFAAAISLSALAAPALAGMGNQMGNGVFWTHNTSWMTANKNGSAVAIRYDAPRAGLQKVGIRKGTVLFRGRAMSGNRLAGTAYAFKKGCQPASYNVTGKFTSEGQGAYTIVLRGAAPVRKGCTVTGYKRTGSNAKLVFRYAGTGD